MDLTSDIDKINLNEFQQDLTSQRVQVQQELDDLESNLKRKRESLLKISRSLGENRAIINEIKENKEKLSAEKSECPTCLTPIEDAEHKNRILKRLNERLEKHVSEKEQNEVKMKTIEKEKKELTGLIEEKENNLKIIEMQLRILESLIQSKKEIHEREHQLLEFFIKL